MFFFFFAGDGLQGNALPTGRSSRESGLVQKTRRGVKPSSRGVNEPFPSSLSFAKGYPLLPVFIATKRLVHVFYESSREMSISFFLRFSDFALSLSLWGRERWIAVTRRRMWTVKPVAKMSWARNCSFPKKAINRLRSRRPAKRKWSIKTERWPSRAWNKDSLRK